MTYGKCPALSQSIGETAGLKLSAGKGLSILPAVIGPSGRDYCLNGRNHPCPVGIKSVSPLRQIRLSTSRLVPFMIFHLVGPKKPRTRPTHLHTCCVDVGC